MALARVLEDLHHALHSTRRARDVGGGVAFVTPHHAQQIHRPALGYDLDVIDLKLLSFDKAGFDFGGDQGVVAARAQIGDRSYDQLALHRADFGGGACNVQNVGSGALGGYLPGQQHIAVVACDVDMRIVPVAIHNRGQDLVLDDLVVELSPSATTVGGDQRARAHTRHDQRNAAVEHHCAD